ncbi:MAG: ATP-binding protein [Mycoplasmataceae bacterium]|nr:ATP-binding protein [Mycoplasmataceae bacterium]
MKIITGIRRCGKSQLMEQFFSYLKKKYPSNANIIFINFDNHDNKELTDKLELKKYIDKQLSTKKKTFLLLDEIQNVAGFEELILHYFQNKNIDIYLTGSNSHMLSKQIATRFTERDLQIKVWPFSFAEVLQLTKEKDVKIAFNDFINYGGMPGLISLKDNQVIFQSNASSIVNSILTRDLIPFFNITNTRLIEKLLSYVFSNIGNSFSALNVKNYFISNNIYKTIAVQTIEKYLQYLADGFLLLKCLRYDIKGKEKLKTLYKLYTTDQGIKNSLIQQKINTGIGDNIENIVYVELLRRGYVVNYGTFQYKDGVKKTTVIKEIDFVCQKQNETLYIQVANDISNDSALNRELEPFKNIRDGRKILINNSEINTMIDGVEIKEIKKWLLSKII